MNLFTEIDEHSSVIILLSFIPKMEINRTKFFFNIRLKLFYLLNFIISKLLILYKIFYKCFREENEIAFLIVAFFYVT